MFHHRVLGLNPSSFVFILFILISLFITASVSAKGVQSATFIADGAVITVNFDCDGIIGISQSPPHPGVVDAFFRRVGDTVFADLSIDRAIFGSSAGHGPCPTTNTGGGNGGGNNGNGNTGGGGGNQAASQNNGNDPDGDGIGVHKDNCPTQAGNAPDGCTRGQEEIDAMNHQGATDGRLPGTHPETNVYIDANGNVTVLDSKGSTIFNSTFTDLLRPVDDNEIVNSTFDQLLQSLEDDAIANTTFNELVQGLGGDEIVNETFTQLTQSLEGTLFSGDVNDADVVINRDAQGNIHVSGKNPNESEFTTVTIPPQEPTNVSYDRTPESNINTQSVSAADLAQARAQFEARFITPLDADGDGQLNLLEIQGADYLSNPTESFFDTDFNQNGGIDADELMAGFFGGTAR